MDNTVLHAGRDKTCASEISKDISHSDLNLSEAGLGDDNFDLDRTNALSQNRQNLSLL